MGKLMLHGFTATSPSPRSLELLNSLLSSAFDAGLHRTPRSAEYRSGVRAFLLARLGGESLTNPCELGSASADAFYAGMDEGRRILADHVEQRAKVVTVALEPA
jgi:hypothetical protein